MLRLIHLLSHHKQTALESAWKRTETDLFKHSGLIDSFQTSPNKPHYQGKHIGNCLTQPNRCEATQTHPTFS